MQSEKPVYKSSHGKTVAIVLLVLVLLFTGAGVYLIYSSRLRILHELNDTQTQLQVARDVNSQLQTQITTLKTANSHAQYIIMSELGVRIPKTSDLQNIVSGTETIASPNQPFTHFTSAEILTSVMANPAGPYSSNQCALSDSPLGVITRYESGSIVFGKKVETLTDPMVKKLGSFYYVYTNSPSQCSSNRIVNAIITPQQQAFAAAFANLELIPDTSETQ